MNFFSTETKTSDIINYNRTDELLEEIFDFRDKNNLEGDLVGIILSYCEENDYRLEEVAEVLSESKNFKKMLEASAEKYNHFQTDEDFYEMDDEEW